MRAVIRHAACALCAAVLLFGCTACSSSNKTEPTYITIWNYYNGDQLESFNKLVSKFNRTVGKEQNIVVESLGQGGVEDLETKVLNAAEGKVGAEEMPNIFSAYSNTAFDVDELGFVVDLAPYISDELREKYIDSYMTEGDFNGNGEIKIFPVAKSTELLFLNDTDWADFAAATGTSYDELATIEGVTAVAEKYYNWTDSLTAEPNDGKAFFGRDSMSNYMLVGAQQLGCTIFDVQNGKVTINFDKDVARKLWDNYYVPFVKGYFSAGGNFRNDGLRTGKLIAYVGSSSSGTYFPDIVTTGDTSSHSIELKVLQAPQFDGGEAVAVQQGAGMVVTKGTDEEIAACVTFLEWFTESENNIEFSACSGYLPVTKDANSITAIRSAGSELSESMDKILSTAVQTVKSNRLYTTRAFKNGRSARSVLEYAMSDRAGTDRAVVEQRIADGMSAKAAQAEFLTDAYFEKWYSETLAQLKQYES